MPDLGSSNEYSIVMLYTQILSNPALMEMFSDKDLFVMMRAVRDFAKTAGIDGVNSHLSYREDIAAKEVAQFKRTLGRGPKSNMF